MLCTLNVKPVFKNWWALLNVPVFKAVYSVTRCTSCAGRVCGLWRARSCQEVEPARNPLPLRFLPLRSPPSFFSPHNQFSDRCWDSRSESQNRKQAKRLQNTAEVPLLLLWGGSLFLSFFISVKSRVYKLLCPGTCTCSRRSLSSSIYKCMDISYAMILNSLLIR